ncbi:tRNA dimethylallyltransferase [Alphaproteobacteria bacterium SO-S41]|nr:tRNA dimethylallyltransferase [Alphaproteobacteria bacterium SO-S41]
MIDTVLIAGPTASGKSAVALEIARATGGVIVNADSMQVYRELRILSARPSEADEAAAEHRLFGMVSVLEHFSVARWLEAARATLADIHGAGRVAIVTGGTGLYFKALEEGLAPAPSSVPALREEAKARREALGPEAFHAELVTLDPAAAALAPGDTQRTLRAWEVVKQSGRGLADWADAQTSPAIVVPERTVRLVVDMDRHVLNARIDARFGAMMAAGAMDEARAFWALNPDPMSPAAKALGLSQLKQVMDGTLGLEEAEFDIRLKTRRYAKRQSTWFRNQTTDWLRADATEKDAAYLAGAVLAAMAD